MKLSKRKIAVVSLILCIAAIISLSSLAWFTDTDEVENTLKFVTDFEIEVYENDDEGHKVVDTNGEPIGRTYENLMPGDTIKKQPYVVNKSSTEEMWVRMKVTLTDYSLWSKIVKDGADLTDIFKGFDSAKWTRYDAPVVDGDNDTVTYTFYLNSVLGAGSEEYLFTNVVIPTGLTNEQAQQIQYSRITVTAEAIQTTGFSDSVETAYDAFGVVYGS